MVAEEQGPFVEQVLSRQERRATERKALKDRQARDRSVSHFRQFQNYVVGKATRGKAEKLQAQEREQARASRVKAKAKPLYPQKKDKEEPISEHQL
jgi:hypothetical protein